MRTVIKVWKGDKSWMTTSTDPIVKELFGTDTLPTAFTPLMPVEWVMAEIKRLNPECEVRLLEPLSPSMDMDKMWQALVADAIEDGIPALYGVSEQDFREIATAVG